MMRFNVANMTCGGCAKSVTSALLRIDPKAVVETDPPTREVRVESVLDESTLLTVLSKAGYPATASMQR